MFFCFDSIIFIAGFRWLLSEISKDHVDLSRRVEKDVAEQVNKTNWVSFNISKQMSSNAFFSVGIYVT